MFESITRSIEIMKKCAGVLMGEKKLLIFPLLSGIALIAILLSFALPVFLLKNDSLMIAMAFLFYFVSYLIVIFFNSALIHAATQKLEGKPISLMGSVSFSVSRILSIAMWAALAATVGIILSMLRSAAERQRGIGALIAGLVTSLIGMAWSVATFFVVPIIIFENKGLFSGIKRSIELVKGSFGEQMIGTFAIGAVFGILYLLGIVLIIVGVVIPPLLLVVVPVAIAYMAALFIVQGALEGIFIAELYRFATTGQATVFKDQIADAKAAPAIEKK